MPRKDGYQACREIREWEKAEGHPQLPMIALSANVMSDVQDKCLRAGFNSYVTKPVDFIQLSTSIAQYFIDPDAEDEDDDNEKDDGGDGGRGDTEGERSEGGSGHDESSDACSPGGDSSS
jgi:DNA-binding response OmpR family regulator